MDSGCGIVGLERDVVGCVGFWMSTCMYWYGENCVCVVCFVCMGGWKGR